VNIDSNDENIRWHPRGAILRPSFCIVVVPPQEEGAGNAGRFAHPQPRLQKQKSKRA